MRLTASSAIGEIAAAPGRDPKGPRMTTIEAGLFESGGPVLIAPPLPQPQMGTNVLIAWNCSTEQARVTLLRCPSGCSTARDHRTTPASAP